jgi:lipopolysaccharide export system protein LptA
MKRSEATRYARWSASVAVILAAATTGVYLQRGLKARTERRNAPAAAAQNISRQSNGLSFSKVEGNRKVFTVDASRSTDFKDRDLTELEAVVITIFGATGERHDVIHTQSCQYAKNGGNVICNGAVEMDLQSAPDAERAAKGDANTPPQIMHVETKEVTFNRASGTAATAQEVRFVFPNGRGRGVGMHYESELGTVKLLKDVTLNLRPPVQTKPGAKKKSPAKSALLAPATGTKDAASGVEVNVNGSSLEFDRAARKMEVQGPASAVSKTARLTAGLLTLGLDARFHAQKLVASGEVNGAFPQVTSQGARGNLELSAELLTAQFAPEGWLSKIDADGHVRGSRQFDVQPRGKSPAERDDLSAERASVTMWPRVNQVKDVELHRNVVLASFTGSEGDARTLRTEALRMDFSGGKEGDVSAPTKAETLAPGRMEWTDGASADPTGSTRPGAKTPAAAPAHTTLAADKLQMFFGALGKAKQLTADGHVRTTRTMAGRPPQTATARSGIAQFVAAGGWSQMDLQGDVKLQDADRNGQADHAVFRRVEQTAVLTGHALVRDATTETAAPRIAFEQDTGDIRADGGVRSTDLPGRNSAIQLAPAPTHVTSDKLQANSKSGHALYTGHARMWQGESVLEADQIELLRDTRVMNADGNIRAAFPQVSATTAAGTVATPAARNPPSPSAVVLPAADVATAAPKKQNLWHVTAGSLVYRDADNHAHLEHNVVAQSADQKMRGPVVDLYFTRSGNPAAAPSQNGPQQISKAVGTGGVIVEEAGRKAVADRGVYTASDGKFVMSGGTPTLYDGSAGTTAGRQLTFFLADDTIIVDSENGSRILTKHRVEK